MAKSRKPSSTPNPASRVVENTLGHLVTDGKTLKRPPLKELRADVQRTRADFHVSLATFSMRHVHREFCASLAKQGYAPISYNTLRAWLSPLPS